MELNNTPKRQIKKLDINVLTEDQFKYLNKNFDSTESVGTMYVVANLGIFAMLDLFADQLRHPDTTSREDHRQFMLNLLHSSGVTPKFLNTYLTEIINGVNDLITKLNNQAREYREKENMN